MPYQSPIILNKSDLIYINQELTISGKNNGAVFDKKNKIFNIQDNIFLYKNHQKYKLIQYHFHVPSEHKLKDKKYPGEIHYVFIQLNDEGNHYDNDEGNHYDNVENHEENHYDNDEGNHEGNHYDNDEGNNEGNHEGNYYDNDEGNHEKSYQYHDHEGSEGSHEGSHEGGHHEGSEGSHEGSHHEGSHHEGSHHEGSHEGSHQEGSHEGSHHERCLGHRRYRRRHSYKSRHSSCSDSGSDSSGSDSCESSGCCGNYFDLCFDDSIYGIYRGFSNILVIGKLIENYEYYINALDLIHDSFIDLTKIQCTVPKKYFEYDGTLTTGTFDPVRWIVDDDVLMLDVKKLGRFAKKAREVQLLDGRIILFKNE